MYTTIRLKLARLSADVDIRRLLQNANMLLNANGISFILTFVSATLTARTLGASDFGTLALITAYQATIGSFVSFQAWQAIVKYGNDVLQLQRPDSLKPLFKFGFLLDSGGALLSFVIALIGVIPTTLWLGWDTSLRPWLYLYSFLLLFNIGGTPTGILRLYHRFDLLSRVTIVDVVVKLIGVVLCAITKQGLGGFLLVYLLTSFVGTIFRIVIALLILRQHQLLNFLSSHIDTSSFPGIWRFVWTTNFNSTVRLATREIDIFFVAAFTSPTMVGYYKIAKQFSRIFVVMLDPVGQTLYPELSKLWANNDKIKFWRLVRLSNVFAGSSSMLLWLGLLVVGQWIIPILFGNEFAPAYTVVIVYAFGWAFGNWGIANPHAALAKGRPQIQLWGTIVATLVYITALPILTSAWGLIGSGFSLLVYSVVWITYMMISLNKNQ